MPSNKRPGDDADGGSARKKQAGLSTRTGQACDRCKVRKIRCDARVGGCSPCLQNNTECKTTDRITGRATSRGHTEKIEVEISALKMYVVELQQQLREQGVDPKPAPHASSGYGTGSPYWPSSEPQAQSQSSWSGMGTGEGASTEVSRSEHNGSSGSALPGFRVGLIGDNYLGVSSGTNWLSPIEGTSLSLFGMKIDIADFLPPENDPRQSPTSYETFLDHAFCRQKPPYRPPLPSYETCNVYAQWYFRSVQQYLPILHKPDFMHLLTRIHHENYQTTPAETVMIHMMLALIMFQYSSRNGSEQTRLESNQHCHYALSFVPELFKGHQLQDVQALAMICQYLRSQSRVGAAWMFTNTVFGLAIELGLHRSAKAWPEQLTEQETHVVEMRKRIFWSLLALHTTIGGKLGRPMPLRVDDFDIEMPEAMNDNLPGEANLSKWRKCSFRPATQMFKLNKIEMQVWSIIYSIRAPSEPHEMILQKIEQELQAFKAQLPPEFSGGPQSRDEDRITTLYIQLLEHEIRLIMHHPSLCRSLSPQSIANSYDVCLDAANKLLHTASQIKALKSLDTTWYYAADFIAAIFTTLFIFSERKDQVTSIALQRLRTDMDAWIDVMAEVGTLLGTGPRLAEAIQRVIDSSLSSIGRHIATKTASAAVASTTSPASSTDHSTSQQPVPTPGQIQQQQHQQQTAPPSQQQHQQQQQQSQLTPQQHQQQQQQQHPPYNDSNGYSHTYPNDGSDGRMNNQTSSYPMQPANRQPHSQHPYTSGGHFAYSQQDGSIAHYAPNPLSSYDTSYPEDTKPPIDAQLAAHPQTPITSQQPANFLATFHSPNAVVSNGYPTQVMNGNPAWRSFTNSMMTNLATAGAANQGGYIHTTNTLIDMGGAHSHVSKGPPSLDMQAVVASMNAAGGAGGMGGLQLGDAQAPWPLMHYGPDSSGQGGNGP